MPKASLKNETEQKRSSPAEDLFFDYPLHAVWQKTGKLVYSDEWGELAYEKLGSTCVVAGDPRGKSLKNRRIVFENFLRKAHQKGLCVCGYYFSEEFSKTVPMNRHQAGVSLLVDVDQWSLKGRGAEEARRALRKGQEQPLTVTEIFPESLAEWESALIRFSREWRQSKGIFQIGFLLTPLSQSFRSLKRGERLFACLRHGEVDAVVSIVPWADGRWYLDQLMQHPLGDRFALDFLLVKVINKLKSERAQTLSLGFCPGVIRNSHTWVERVLKTWGRLKVFYSPKGLYNFKKKYSSTELNRYLLLDPKGSQSHQLIQMERATLSLEKAY